LAFVSGLDSAETLISSMTRLSATEVAREFSAVVNRIAAGEGSPSGAGRSARLDSIRSMGDD
jgi:hypothetical protein